MEIIQRPMDQAAEQHRLKARWSKIELAEDQVLPGTPLVSQEVSGIGVAARSGFGHRAAHRHRANVELGNRRDTVIEQRLKLAVRPLTFSPKMGQDKQVLRPGQ